jgi:hypothetical protein
MHTSFVLAAAFASVVAAQTSTAADSTTSAAPAPGEAMGVNAFNIPAEGLGPASAGKAFKVTWNAEGGNADGAVQIKVVYGPSTAVVTGPVVYSAASNTGSADITIEATDVPDVANIALLIEEKGEKPNFSPQFGFSGGEGEADSGSASGSSAEATATPTETDASTLETLASTDAEPMPTESFSSNSTVTGGANTAIATESESLPTETESGSAASASPTDNAGSAIQVSFAALFAGLVATVFAL